MKSNEFNPYVKKLTKQENNRLLFRTTARSQGGMEEDSGVKNILKLAKMKL